MAFLPENSTFDSGVYQIETTDPVLGGPNGVTNSPLKNLANRTKYLKDHVDAIEAAYAPKASPAFTGTPTAPTAAAGNSSTQVATTAFVNAEIAADAAPISHVGSTGTAHGVATTSVAGFMSATDKSKLDGIATGAAAVGSVAPSMDGTAAAGTATTAARSDHVHPTDTSRAPIASPAFSGAPTAPSPAVADDSTRIATTNWVRNALANIASAAGFASNFGTNGYIKFPSWLGGFIIQWGFLYVPGTTTGYMNWPIYFPNAALAGVACKTDGANNEVLNIGISQSGCSVDNYPGGITNSAYVIVVGY